MSSLAICMIVRNESASLSRCIASLGHIYDELCIVDTGSDDSTVEVARSLGAMVVVERSFSDELGCLCDFAAARNASLDIASAEWILQIDADEVPDQQWHEALLQHVARRRTGAIAVELTTGAMTFAAVRLFSRDPRHRYVGLVHEHLAETVDLLVDRNVRIQNLPNKIGKGKLVERDIRLCELRIRQAPEDFRYHHYYARAPVCWQVPRGHPRLS
jgi:glycosyltransferase involved in cell wall biosynthesis